MPYTPCAPSPLTPLRRYADEAYDLMLPFYGIKDRKERRAAVKTGRIHALARVLQGLDWGRLAQRMGQGEGNPQAPGAG